jgi:hypothetical protein
MCVQQTGCTGGNNGIGMCVQQTVCAGGNNGLGPGPDTDFVGACTPALILRHKLPSVQATPKGSVLSSPYPKTAIQDNNIKNKIV